jgi:hypothetical protein
MKKLRVAFRNFENTGKNFISHRAVNTSHSFIRTYETLIRKEKVALNSQIPKSTYMHYVAMT